MARKPDNRGKSPSAEADIDRDRSGDPADRDVSRQDDGPGAGADGLGSVSDDALPPPTVPPAPPEEIDAAEPTGGSGRSDDGSDRASDWPEREAPEHEAPYLEASDPDPAVHDPVSGPAFVHDPLTGTDGDPDRETGRRMDLDGDEPPVHGGGIASGDSAAGPAASDYAEDDGDAGSPPRHASDSIIPMLIGGVLAAAVGFFAARYLENAPTEATGPGTAELVQMIETQEVRLSGLQAAMDDLTARDIDAQIGGATEPLQVALGDFSARIDSLNTIVSGLADRVETVAMRPDAPGLDPGEFDQALTEFRGELAAAIEDARAEIEDARAEAQEITDRAFASEQAAAARGAWQQVMAVITTGDPYAEELDRAREAIAVDIPAPVADSAADGIATLVELQERFTERARMALDTSIRTSAGGSMGERFGAFLRVQTGARSLAPRDGDDPDAILSRAEDAVRRGDLDAALEEIAALPAEGQNAMRPWVADVERRIAVLASAAEVTRQLDGE